MTLFQQESKYLMNTYATLPIEIAYGQGSYLFDKNNKKYIDFTSGIGVNSLGYNNSEWKNSIISQLNNFQHLSNIFTNNSTVSLAKKLCELSGMSKVFFANSGAEANECAIKLARKYSTDKYNENRTKIITLVNSFHGRTVTTLAATGQDTFHHYFNPFTEGFTYAQANDIESVKSLLDENTCAVFIEMIQGEGGVMPLEPHFVKELEKLCKKHDVLLMVDEVQTGMGRTGTLFCYEQYGIEPDVITSSKALGGGLPIGACLCTERLGDVLNSGMHGSTFGGNPVACAGALSVLERVSDETFLQEVKAKGEYMQQKLSEMEGVAEVRGIGMMIGIVLEKGTAKDVAAACIEHGLLVLTAKTLVRLLPPLTITFEEIDKGLAILEKVIKQA